MGRPALRTAAVCVVSIGLVPLLSLNVYLLLWFLPELTGWGTTGTQYVWIATFVLTAAAAGCLALAWTRRHRSVRWWAWPLAAVLLVALSLPAPELL